MEFGRMGSGVKFLLICLLATIDAHPVTSGAVAGGIVKADFPCFPQKGLVAGIGRRHCDDLGVKLRWKNPFLSRLMGRGMGLGLRGGEGDDVKGVHSSDAWACCFALAFINVLACMDIANMNCAMKVLCYQVCSDCLGAREVFIVSEGQ